MKTSAEMPSHIAIIMDGNGRWSKKRMLSKIYGHRKGAQVLQDVIKEASRLGVKYLTVYAFSTENWKRPQDEVDSLMNLLREYIKNFYNDIDKNEGVLKIIGRRDRIAKDILEKIEIIEDKTKDRQGMTIIIAIDYGARNEIIRGFKKIANDYVNKNLDINDIDEEIFSNYLDTKGIPDPDLLIRTSGESRMSNFLLWQIAYSELYFTDKLWPDFKPSDLKDAISEFQKRDRRYGG